MTVNGKTYTNAFPFNGKFHLVSVYYPFKTVHAKRLNGWLVCFKKTSIRLAPWAKRLNGSHIRFNTHWHIFGIKN